MLPPEDAGMETPLAPLPEGEAEAQGAPKRGRRGKKRGAQAGDAGSPARTDGTLASFRSGVGYMASAWRVLLAVMVVHLALAATLVLPLQKRMSARLDHHAHAPALAGEPDKYDARLDMWQEGGLEASVWNDTKRLEKPLLDTQRITLYWVVLIAWLFGAVVSGGHVGLVVGGESPTVAGFLVQGARWFWRMLRVGFVFAIVYYVIGRIVLELWSGVVQEDEKWATTSAVLHRGEQIRLGVMVLTVLWLRVVCDLARADLVVFGRTSALGAVLRGFGRTFRHPIRTFGLALLFGVPMLALVFGIALALDAVGTSSWVTMFASFALIQVAVLLRLGSRAALLAGDAHLLMTDVRGRAQG